MWEVVDYGDYGSILREEYRVSNDDITITGHVTRLSETWFAEVEKPYWEDKEFATKSAAKKWVERFIKGV